MQKDAAENFEGGHEKNVAEVGVMNRQRESE
jgi:hypothetical protein